MICGAAPWVLDNSKQKRCHNPEKSLFDSNSNFKCHKAKIIPDSPHNGLDQAREHKIITKVKVLFRVVAEKICLAMFQCRPYTTMDGIVNMGSWLVYRHDDLSYYTTTNLC